MQVDCYSFDGLASIRCNKCRTVHQVAFDGTDLDTVEDAIKNGLEESGWDSSGTICSSCNDQIGVPENESGIGLDVVDECLDDYDIEDDEDDYDTFLEEH